MYRVIVFIEFTFGDEDCFVAYPAGEYVGSRHDVASLATILGTIIANQSNVVGQQM